MRGDVQLLHLELPRPKLTSVPVLTGHTLLGRRREASQINVLWRVTIFGKVASEWFENLSSDHHFQFFGNGVRVPGTRVTTIFGIFAHVCFSIAGGQMAQSTRVTTILEIFEMVAWRWALDRRTCGPSRGCAWSPFSFASKPGPATRSPFRLRGRPLPTAPRSASSAGCPGQRVFNWLPQTTRAMLAAPGRFFFSPRCARWFRRARWFRASLVFLSQDGYLGEEWVRIKWPNFRRPPPVAGCKH